MNFEPDSAVPTALSPLDILADELGSVAGRIERELRQGYEATIAKLEARISALELAALRAENDREAKVSARLAELRDGRDGKDADIAPLMEQLEQETAEFNARFMGLEEQMLDKLAEVDARLAEVKNGEDGKPGEPGKDADITPVLEKFAECDERMAVWQKIIERELSDAVDAKLAQVRDGKDGLDGEPGKEGPPGKLPIAKQWTSRVHYEGDVVIHNGSTYQALRDTGGEPPGGDWQLLAGKGSDARGLTIRRTYDPEAKYERNDVVAFNGSSFVALVDEPGKCPGDGWQLLASAGKRGPPGEKVKGDPGVPGKQGPHIIAGEVDAEALTLTFVNSEGEKIVVDLYPLAEALRS